MRLPRDLSGEELVRRLAKLGYEPTRQRGSHVRLSRHGPKGENHLTVPMHSPLRIGTLNAILNDVAQHLGIDRSELLRLIS